MSDSIDRVLNVIDDRCVKNINIKQRDYIKTRVGEVVSYDNETLKAYVIFLDDETKEIHTYYNKTSELLEEKDQVRIFYTTNIDKGWIGLRLGEPNLNVVSEPEWDGVAQILRTDDSAAAVKTYTGYIQLVMRDKTSGEDKVGMEIIPDPNGIMIFGGDYGTIAQITKDATVFKVNGQQIVTINQNRFAVGGPPWLYFNVDDSGLYFTNANKSVVDISNGTIRVYESSIVIDTCPNTTVGDFYITNMGVEITPEAAEIYFDSASNRRSLKFCPDGTGYLNGKRILTEDDLT